MIPEIFLGRFSVANVTDLSNIIGKTMSIEQNLHTYDKRNCFLGGVDENNGFIAERTHNEVIDKYLNVSGYENIKHYANSDPSVSKTGIMSTLNDGVIFCVYSGHGMEEYWVLTFGSNYISIDASDAEAMTSSRKGR